ncbi:anhydro-N-acetylmuramic acid kinase [Lutibacter sp. Hel_I_33_5]|uniref:anhydro-N-acetylmuramic acid kinase n=1 Tax=Lutibacter sp. Hel_I_33_5 TaxID=1566289 RepID=UPI0011A82167|nr:anhydro-N-acetylmuramic acid kinase [Lutibacter sp. Hel_I_33_5]TVZ55524.1 anhydro-N-acetylmuramic acid kinase [Lutibacter sp. Hel_I_33_5]
MNSDFCYVIGLMSGTSLDGLDIVYAYFDESDYKNFKIIFSETISYSNDWKENLQKAINFSTDELYQLDIDYGQYLGEKVNEFTKKNKIKVVDFIASHGHTILHQPDKGITLQVGSGEQIAKITNKKVVCDFRTQDVKFGGQGAPLVPIGDELLFSDYDYCLNLGGFANISFRESNKRIAFDICPVNIVLNHYVQKLGFMYDDKGEIASKGKINQQLLDTLNSLEFYKTAAPKSLGLEWVQSAIFPLIDSFENNIASILKTFIEHVAIQISMVYKNSSSILITGGGAFNKFLISRVEFYSETKIQLPDKQLIDFKEALIFAFLGVLKTKNQINCLQSVTGAKKDHSSGVLFYP